MQIIYKLKKPMMVFYCGLSPIAIGIILVASWAQYAPITRSHSIAVSFHILAIY